MTGAPAAMGLNAANAGRAARGREASARSLVEHDQSLDLASILAPRRGATDLLLRRLATHLAQHGVRTAGTVQINAESDDGRPCDMDVQVLPDGPVIRISQDLGRASRGCRLDPAALEQAIALAAVGLADDAQILFVNKFGKHEAEGRGFRALIADALARNIPVIVGLNALNEPAFEAFADGFAQRLSPDLVALKSWAASALARRANYPF